MPRQEFHLAGIMSSHGFEVIHPKEIRWRRRRGGRTQARHDTRFEPFDYPVFPCMMFARIDSERQWNAVRNMPFIGRPLGLNGLPYSLPAQDVDWLRQIAGTYSPAKPTANPHVKVGDRVKIAVGALAGHTITVQDIHKDRAQSFVSLLGKLVPVNIPLGNLERAA